MSVEHWRNRTDGENELYLTCVCLRSISLYRSERLKTNSKVHNDDVHISTLKIYFLQHSKHTTSVTKTNGLNLFREIITVYYKIKYVYKS